jgi:hypothetical protein
MMALPTFRPDLNNDLRTFSRIEQTIRICLAGPLAEAKLTGRYNLVGASSDNSEAADLALYRCGGSDEAASAYLKWLSIETRGALDLKMIWDGVDELAAELLEHEEIGWRKARKVIQYGMDRDLRKAYGGEIPPIGFKK